jgi:Uncharacterized protein conserved in bacteria (DUF2188)
MTAIRRTTFEVNHGNNGWVVLRHGIGRDSTHPTKDAAVQRAVELANARQPSELVIRRQDGSIQETRLYGAGPDKLFRI